jgi:flagellar export protein FliJ
MSHRKKRLEKLMQHRQRELDARLLRLSEKRRAEEAARQQLAAEEHALELARADRVAAISKVFDALRLTESNDWMMACAHRRELATAGVLRAQKAVSEAHAQLLSARNDLKKIELLAERLAKEELARAERGEQRLADEFAANRFAETEKRRDES